MPARTDCQIGLKDGRILGYAEYGDPQGRPVLHFHGTPSSRFELSHPVFDGIATRLHVRLLLPERPGFGLSDFKPNRTILDWPDDVVEFADALHLDRFTVMGLSGGGPYTAACACKIPQRLSAAGIVSGAGPLNAPGAFEGMRKPTRRLCMVARKAPWLLRPTFRRLARLMRKNPGKTMEQILIDLPEPDKAVLARSDVKEVVFRMLSGGFQQGERGTAWDWILYARSWGFRLEDIPIPVYLWHGEMDTTAPINMGRYVAKSIPECRAKYYPQDGHFSLFVNHYEELLSAIVS